MLFESCLFKLLFSEFVLVVDCELFVFEDDVDEEISDDPPDDSVFLSFIFEFVFETVDALAFWG